jgi:ABC-type multidrug transport system ATPase subunit
LVTAIVGPNGAGKTTLLRIAAGLQFADAGTLSFRGGLYYGGFDLLPRKGSVNNFRRALGLPPVANGHRSLATLSRGELQKVGLDAALDLAPAVLFLDEPWTGLEPDLREELNERIAVASSERITICSSHDLDEVARVADEVLLLADGTALLYEETGDGGSFDRERLLKAYKASKLQ